MAGNKAIASVVPSYNRARAVRAVMVGALGLLLSSCAGDTGSRVCPQTAILVPTAQSVGFSPNQSGNPSDELFRVEMTRVSSECDMEDDGRARVDIDLNIRATRQPDTAAEFTVPYFVAVTEGRRIVSKKTFTIRLSFAAGQKQIYFRNRLEPTFVYPENGKTAVQYRLLTGFQLTKEQLAYFKKVGRSAP